MRATEVAAEHLEVLQHLLAAEGAGVMVPFDDVLVDVELVSLAELAIVAVFPPQMGRGARPVVEDLIARLAPKSARA